MWKKKLSVWDYSGEVVEYKSLTADRKSVDNSLLVWIHVIFWAKTLNLLNLESCIWFEEEQGMVENLTCSVAE